MLAEPQQGVVSHDAGAGGWPGERDDRMDEDAVKECLAHLKNACEDREVSLIANLR